MLCTPLQSACIYLYALTTPPCLYAVIPYMDQKGDLFSIARPQVWPTYRFLCEPTQYSEATYTAHSYMDPYMKWVQADGYV